MVKTIVTGVDGSPTASAAARRAAELARAFGATLHVISAYGRFQMERYQSGSEEFVYTTEDEAAQVAEGVVAALAGDFAEVRFTVKAAEGKPADALVREAESLGADLIVVGNKRVQGLGRILGSIAEDVAHHSTCDVYIAHTHQR